MKQQTTQNTLRDALQALPVVAPPDDVWAQIERRTRIESDRGGNQRWWLASAAAGLIAITVAALVLTRAPAPSTGDIPVLVAQSQQLERRVLYRAQSTDAWDASRRALLYRIADLDRDLAPLSVDPSRNPARTESLWRQRVALMQSLAEIDRADTARRRTFAL